MALIKVAEFASLKGMHRGHVYHLIHKGNKYRKLRAKQIRGKWYVYSDELDKFPFDDTTKIAELERRIEQLEANTCAVTR